MQSPNNLIRNWRITTKDKLVKKNREKVIALQEIGLLFMASYGDTKLNATDLLRRLVKASVLG